MKGTTWAFGLVALGALGFGACTFHSQPPAEITRLRTKLAETEKELNAIEEQMKDPVADQGTKEHLTTERELIRSRLERIKENLDHTAKTTDE